MEESNHPLSGWKQYLTNNDYEYLIKFVENVKNNKPNDKMIVLLGRSRTGKSRLIKEIALCIGVKNYTLCDTSGSAFLEPLVKLVHIVEVEDYKKKYIQQLKNVIQYKQSIIAETNIMCNVINNIIDYITIIEMKHVFT